jgi:hypothetical protein
MSGAFLVIFTLFWSGMVLLFDGSMGHGIYKQLESAHYPSVAGTITHSEVNSHRGSKGGISYSADIQFTYEVEGQKFNGDKIRYGMSSSSYMSASAIVGVHPVGSAAPVFYNPTNPQESLLLPGVKGSDFMFLLFLTPFNMVMFGFWIWIGGWMREHWFKPVAGGVKIITDGMVTRIRLPQFPAAGWGLAATGGLGFISIFIVGFSTNMEPSTPAALSVIAAVYGVGLGVYLWQRQKINSGIDDLLVNDASRTLELPLTFGRKARISANVVDIAGLYVETIEHRSSKGGISYTYAPTLRLRGAEPSGQKIADWSDKLKADEFTGWLRDKLGASFPAEYVPPISDGDVADEFNYGSSDKSGTASVEISRPEKSKIQITDGPGGREFYFPAARNLGTALFTTLFMLVFSGATVLTYRAHAPMVFPIVFGLIGVILILCAFNLWFKSSRIIINSSNVQLTKSWLIFSRTRDFSAGDYARFATKTGMQSGSQIFSDIKLVRIGADAEFAEKMNRFGGGQQVNQLAAERFRQAAGPSGITVANSIANVVEAEWLVREMNKALGRRT